MNKKPKNSKQMEKHFKGIANHTRIDILLLLDKQKELTLYQIDENFESNFRTISEHTRRLVDSGLLNKKYQGTSVLHTLSPYGKKIINFIKIFQYS